MAIPEKGTRKFDFLADGSIPFIRYRLGVIFPEGEGPESADGVLRHAKPPGKPGRCEKFYLPPAGVSLPADGVTATYAVPQSAQGAPNAELVLNRRAGYVVLLGRHGEEKPFGFAEGKNYIFLRVYRKEEYEFNPLFLKVIRGDEEKYYCMSVVWEGDNIKVVVIPISEKNLVPAHLSKAKP